MAARYPSDRGRSLGGLGVVVATVGLGIASGVWGVLAGVAIAGAWYLFPATYAFAVGQLLAIAAPSADAPLLAVGVAELGLLAVLAGSLMTTEAPARRVAAFAVAALALGAIGWGVLRTGRPLWTAALAVAVVAATAAYAIHRYERVRLGLVDEEVDGPSDDRTTEGAT